nr:L10-interacting MYB domain-containing protein-like [Ipomoea batatas]GMC46193.1 L10-interacting MYB domain-containing protein-like [Ipomoea batatas]GMC67163.1 L10-interacting MYB domain-containing protein-like [Ipomoea batatas]
MSNLRNTHDEDAKWLDSTLVVFLDIVYDRIKQHPNGQPVFKSSSWNEMSQELKDKTGCVYTGAQLSGKYNRCKDLHRRFLEVLNHTGVTFNAETNKAEADDAVWESFFKVWIVVSSRNEF